MLWSQDRFAPEGGFLAEGGTGKKQAAPEPVQKIHPFVYICSKYYENLLNLSFKRFILIPVLVLKYYSQVKLKLLRRNNSVKIETVKNGGPNIQQPSSTNSIMGGGSRIWILDPVY